MAELQANPPKGSCQLPEEKKNLFKKAWKAQFGYSPGTKERVAEAISENNINTSEPTVTRFYKGERVEAASAEIICDACGLNWKDVTEYNADNSEALDDIPQNTYQDIQPVRNNLNRSGVATFVGREETIAEIKESLEESQKIAITTALAGMGGIGKTETALQYAINAYQQKIYPGGVCWLLARDEDIATQLINFVEKRLHVELPENLNDLDSAERVALCWDYWPPGKTLLVYDDVKDFKQIQDFLPPASEARFKVLLTTRLQIAEPIKSIPIDVLNIKQALILLNSFDKHDRLQNNQNTAKDICEWLGRLPLGIELVGRYLARNQDISLAEIYTRLKNQSVDARVLTKTDDTMTAQRGVAAAFELSWRELTSPAQELLVFSGLFALAPFEWSWVKDAFISEYNKETLEEIRDDYLLNLHLIQRVEKGTYKLHELIKEFIIKKHFSDSLTLKFISEINNLVEPIPTLPNKYDCYKFSNRIPHITELSIAYHTKIDHEKFKKIVAGVYAYYSGLSLEKECIKWLERSLDISRQRFGRYNLLTAYILERLGSSYRAIDNLSEAESLLKESFEVYQNCTDSNKSEMSITLSALGTLYAYQGKYSEAEYHYEKATTIRKDFFGEDHHSHIENYSNLGAVYMMQKRFSEAEPYIRKAIELAQNHFGETHREVADYLYILATLRRKQKSFSEAEEVCLEAIRIFKINFEDDHPKFLRFLNLLGMIYYDTKRFDLAQKYLTQALEIGLDSYGESHSEVAIITGGLGHIYYEKNFLVQAKYYYQKAIKTLTEIYGPQYYGLQEYQEKLDKLNSEGDSQQEV